MTNTALDTLSSPSTITADIALLAHKVVFFAAVGSAMSERAYSAVGDERSDVPTADDLAYAVEILGRAMTDRELAWYYEGFAAEHAHWSSDIPSDEIERLGL